LVLKIDSLEKKKKGGKTKKKGEKLGKNAIPSLGQVLHYARLFSSLSGKTMGKKGGRSYEGKGPA